MGEYLSYNAGMADQPAPDQSSSNTEILFYKKNRLTFSYFLHKKIPCQSSPAGLPALFTYRNLPALSAELHHAPVLEEVHP